MTQITHLLSLVGPAEPANHRSNGGWLAPSKVHELVGEGVGRGSWWRARALRKVGRGRRSGSNVPMDPCSTNRALSGCKIVVLKGEGLAVVETRRKRGVVRRVAPPRAGFVDG